MISFITMSIAAIFTGQILLEVSHLSQYIMCGVLWLSVEVQDEKETLWYVDAISKNPKNFAAHHGDLILCELNFSKQTSCKTQHSNANQMRASECPEH